MNAGENTVIDAAAVARRFFAAVEQGDIATVSASYHPNAVIWHNYDGIETSPVDNVKVLAGFIKRAPQRRYANPRLLTTPTGFVQQHVLEATRVDGRKLVLPACVIAEVKQGLITRLDEYFDTAPLAGWYDVG
jgi:ketosteroid isomerase-like protein